MEQLNTNTVTNPFASFAKKDPLKVNNPFAKGVTLKKPTLKNLNITPKSSEEIKTTAATVSETITEIKAEEIVAEVAVETQAENTNVADESTVSTSVENTDSANNTLEVVNENVKNDSVDTVTENDLTESTENTETEKVEASVPKKRTRKKSSTAIETAAETINESAPASIPAIVYTDVSFEDAVKVIHSHFYDEKWLAFKENVEKKYNAIKIDNDVNTSTIINIITQLSSLRDTIWNEYQYYKTQYDALSSKEPEGLIEITKKMNVDANATNDLIRKRSGIIACINYKDPSGNNINLFELLDEVRARYNYLRAMMDNIEFKKNILITISSALKTESSLISNVN